MDPLTELRNLVQGLACELTRMTCELQDLEAEQPPGVAPAEPVAAAAGRFLAALDHTYLEPAAMILWFLDQALDPRRPGSEQARELLRLLAELPAPPHPSTGYYGDAAASHSVS